MNEKAFAVPDGYTTLPPSKLVAFTTYLRKEIEGKVTPPPLPLPFRLERLKGADVARYLALFRAVGENWLWFGHLEDSAAQVASLLDHPDYEAYTLTNGRDCGILCLDFRKGDKSWLDYFGLVQGVIGEGLGQALIKTAFAKVIARGRSALDVHTCMFDHPKALAFYMKNGFVPYARAVECFDDPRLTGLLPRAAAPWLPIMG